METVLTPTYVILALKENQPKPLRYSLEYIKSCKPIYSKMYKSMPKLDAVRWVHATFAANDIDTFVAIFDSDKNLINTFNCLATHYEGEPLYSTSTTWQVSVIPSHAIVPNSSVVLHSQASDLRDVSNKTRYFVKEPTSTELAAFAEKNTRRDTDRCIVLHRAAGTKNYTVCTDIELVSSSTDLL